jgi:hypothetical protein
MIGRDVGVGEAPGMTMLRVVGVEVGQGRLQRRYGQDGRRESRMQAPKHR